MNRSCAPGARLLYVEDDPGLARLCQRRLEREGFDVVTAADGDEGRRLALAGGFDVLLLDHDLPGVKGMDLFRELVAAGFDRPVVLITGVGDEDLAVTALREGVTHYLVKDADTRYLQLLPAVIDQALRRHQLEQAERSAEARLRESERRFRQIADTAPVLMWVSDAEGALTFVNARWLAHTGRRSKEELGVGWLDRVHDDDRESVTGIMQIAYANREPFRVELRLLDSSGAYRWFLFAGAPRGLESRHFPGFTGSAVDITERRAHEAREREARERALEASERRNATFERLSPVGMFQTRADGYLEDVNRRWRAITQLSPEAARGDGWTRAIHPDDRSRAVFTWRDAVASGEDFHAEFRLLHPDGAVVWVYGQAEPERDRRGRVLGYIGTLTDLTERKAAEAVRRDLELELRQAQKLEALGALAAGVAHEFGNVIGVIEHAAANLDEAVTPEARRRAVDQIRLAASDAEAITQALRTYSCKSQQRGERERVDLTGLVSEALELLARVLPKSIVLEFEAPGEALWVEADPVQLRQVLMNLTINARDAMPDGGQVRLELFRSDWLVEGLPTGDETVDHACVLAVEDSGRGMDPDVARRVFEPFFTTKSAHGGSGLGLSVTHGIVADHGGYIEVRSAPGSGSRFEVTLPAAAPPAPAAPDRSAARRAVIVLQPDPFLRALLEDSLAAAGCRAIPVSDAEGALAAAAALAEEAGLLVIDIEPHDASEAAAHAMHAHYPHLPVLLIAGADRPPRPVGSGSRVSTLRRPYRTGDLLSLTSTLLAE